MEEQTKKIIQKKFNELPLLVQSAIKSSDWQQKIREIVSDKNLLIDQGLAIEKETFLMMLGLENPKNYTANIKKAANLSNEQSLEIANIVNEKILKEIKKKIIEESAKEVGVEPNPIDEILGFTKEIEETMPSIDLTPLEPEREEDRGQLISDLEKDIIIDDGSIEEETLLQIPKKEDLIKESQEEVVEKEEPKAIPPTQIPITGDEKRSFRTIEKEQNYSRDSLPNLNPLRTLEMDKNRIEGTHSKKDMTQVPKPEETKVAENEVDQKTSKNSVVSETTSASSGPETESGVTQEKVPASAMEKEVSGLLKQTTPQKEEGSVKDQKIVEPPKTLPQQPVEQQTSLKQQGDFQQNSVLQQDELPHQKEEVVVKQEPFVPQKPEPQQNQLAQKLPQQQESAAQQTKDNNAVVSDPYREPIE